MGSRESQRSNSEESAKDLLPPLKASGVISEKTFEEIRGRIRDGDLPMDSIKLAERLIREEILTEYQARRLLQNRWQGLIIGKYIILDRLGSGAMGRVYKAKQRMMSRTVALKVIAPELAQKTRAVERFKREMRLVGQLDHENVVRAFDADAAGNLMYIAMEYVPGKSLGAMLKEKGPLPWRDVVDYAAQTAAGLGHAHSRGVVHRDIKPSNILLNSDDRIIKVLDLGLGAFIEADTNATFATADNIAVGTIDYMSPEQASGKDVDGRSDLFNLGCSIYHLITGRHAYPGNSPIDRLGKRIHGKPTPILEHGVNLPSSLVKVIEKLLQSDPAERFQTAEQAAEALRAVLRPSPSAQAPRGDAETQAQARPPAEPTIVKIEPRYPGWFRPLASLAEKQPTAALFLLLSLTIGSAILGVFVGKLMR